MSAERFDRIEAKLEEMSGQIKIIEIAMLGDMAGRKGIVHTTNDLRMEIWEKDHGLKSRVTALEGNEGKRRLWVALCTAIGTGIGIGVGWIVLFK